MAGIMLAGSAFSTANATKVTQAQFKGAITNNVLSVNALKGTLEKAGLTWDGKIELSEAVTLDAVESVNAPKQYVIINEKDLVLTSFGAEKQTFTGRIVVADENVTISNLKVTHNVPAQAWGGFLNNTTITVFADKAAITDNEITGTVEGSVNCVNGIVVYPQTENVNYTIEGNTLKGFSKTVEDSDNAPGGAWYSSAVQVYQGAKKPANSSGDGDSFPAVLQGLNGVKENSKTAILKEGAAATLAAAINTKNTFDGNDADVFVRVNLEGSDGGAAKASTIDAAYVSNTTTDGVKAALKDAAKAKAVINFAGTAEELQKLAGDNVFTGEGYANAAVACSDVNVLYGDAENPQNGQDAIINGLPAAIAKVGDYTLIESETSEYCLLILTNQNNIPYVVYADADGKGSVKDFGTDGKLSDYATDPNALWKMSKGVDVDGRIYYSFKNQNDKELKANVSNATGDAIWANKGKFFALNNVPYHKGVGFAINGGTLEVTTPSTTFGLYTAGYNTLSVEDLKWFEKDGFSVTIKHQNDKGEFKKEDIAGNPFVGHLKVVEYAGNNKFVEATSEFEDGKLVEADKDFYLMNAEGKLIVAQKYASSGSNSAQNTYTFTTVTAQALSHDIEKKEGKYFGVFQAEVSAKYKTDSYKDLKVVDLLSVKIGDKFAPIGRLDLGTNEEPTLAASFGTALKPIQVNLGGKDLVVAKKFLQKNFFTVTKLGENGGMLAVAGDKYEGGDYMYNFVSKVGNDLEKQFALTIEGGNYVFRNRENGYAYFRIPVGQLYYGKEDNEYLYGADTYRIEAVAEHKAIDGYEKLPDVKNNKFHISYASGIFGDAWFTENHEGEDNHTIGLSTDKDAALVFTATEFAREREIKHDKTTHKDTYIPTDSIYVISTLGYYDGDTYKTDHKDTLTVVSYSFVNQYGEPLVWNGNRYVSSTEKSVAADKFALRKDNGKLNLRPVVGEWDSQGKHYTSWISAGDNESYLTHQYFGTTNKAYAGDADEEGILSQTYMYNRTENDLFTVEPTEKPMYRTVINPLDTISIFRNDNPKSILFEDKGFLGMENLAQYPSIAPAMVADTAYVRDNTYRPQYMLVVNPDITPAGMWCEEHQSATCEHAVPTKGWVEGRYLVNLVDTAIVWDQANKHKDNNPYINTEKFYRLGFVQAKHIEDSLIIASTNDTLMVGTEDYNQAKFAFRYVNTDAKSFRIETANYKRLPGVKEAEIDEDKELGYVKWMNGVVVVVDEIEDGDIFNMNEEEEGDPTANGTIATEGVSVVATNGAIIVKGAEGKNVVITNVLGQQIANTVVTSSEATIAAPAGIVVVAVEGEAAVKAIVK